MRWVSHVVSGTRRTAHGQDYIQWQLRLWPATPHHEQLFASGWPEGLESRCHGACLLNFALAGALSSRMDAVACLSDVDLI